MEHDMEYYDEQYENFDEYGDDYDDYDDEWVYDDYYGPEEPPTRWQRVKAWFRSLWWKAKYTIIPQDMDDIPF
jgi:hypothetical protein